MSVQINQPGVTIKVATTDIAARLLISPAGVVTVISTVRDWVGATQEPRKVGEFVNVRLPHAGTMILTASEAIVLGDQVYKAAGGKVSKTSTGSVRVGIALEAASGNGLEFQVLPD